MKNSFTFSFGILLVVFLALVASCSTDLKKVRVSSPDNKLIVNFALDKDGSPSYTVSLKNQTVIDTSSLGFVFKDGSTLTRDLEIVEIIQTTFDETWEPVWGEFSKIRNHYNELTVKLKEENEPNREMNLIFRVFDDGIGFRYELPEQPNLKEIEIMSEVTQFKFNDDHTAWWIPGAKTGKWAGLYEHLYTESSVSSLDTVATPLTIETSDGLYLSIHEAALLNYADMTLSNSNKDLTLEAYLIPWPDGVKVKATTPLKTPWRTIQIATKPGDLIESQLILNLNEPLALEDVSWIKPMKFMGVWWGMLISYYTWGQGASEHISDTEELESDLGFGVRHGATTANAKRYIDFASKHGIPALLIEGWKTGWESWGADDAFDWITPYDDFDLEGVVAYGKQKGVVIIGHHETGGQVPRYEEYLDTAMALYNKLGVPVVKTGYAGKIRPEGMRRHGQWMVNHYTKVMKKAADYKISLDIHEPIKFTGLSRTYPNLMTGEGAVGMEYNAFSKGNPPQHTTILPFTRLLSGPMDYTPGIFDLKFEKHRDELIKAGIYSKDRNFRVHTTLAKQLAYYVIIYSPLQMVADLLENYENQPAFKFILDVPVDWDETKVLDARIGDFVIITRKEKGSDNWFIGGITDEESREFDVPLDFLKVDKKYIAEIFADAPETDLETNPTAVEISKYAVDNKTVLKMRMAAGGGQAISLFAASEDEIDGLPQYSER